MTKRFSTGLFQSVFPQPCGVLAFGLIAPLLLLSACTEQPSVVLETNQQGGLSASFTPPDMLTQSRAIVQSALQLSVTVNQQPNSVAIASGSEPSILSIPATRGETLNIIVTWSEEYEGQLLTLAEAEVSVTIPVDAGEEYSFSISSDDYVTNTFDDDGDQISNLDERNGDTDPFTQPVLEDPIVQVPIEFQANIPEQLREVSDDINDTIFAVADIDNVQQFTLTREGDTWVGAATVSENTDVRVSYSFYSSIRPNVKLAIWQGRINSGETGIKVEISSGDYEYNIDSDGDGKYNIQEVIAGTSPEDKNDPLPNPCDISNFEPGCNTDTDGDGTPDSVETENADADGDSIPDYKESKNDDADEDGSDAELDRDETDPCVPDDQAIACDNAEPDEPPASPLTYEYYEGRFENMPDFSILTPSDSGTAATFTLPPSNGEQFYALQFKGKLLVEQADEYTFYSESDDGSLLFINGNEVVNNDGTHALAEESGVVVLPEGLHDIVLQYFQNNGSEGLTVSWSSSTISKQVIPEDVLFAP